METKKISSEDTEHGRLLKLSLAALGVVFGDIGTSPLYAIKECFTGDYGIAPTPENILGVLSLIFWTLLIIVTLKYLIFILRADNEGEGGVIALTGIIKSFNDGRYLTFILLGLFAASMLYGDGMITPAISVLSAVGGLSVIAPGLHRFVIPITIAILVGLFSIQSRGTARVGSLFGPVILIWFLTLAILGGIHIAANPGVFRALNPYYGFRFLFNGGLHAFIVLGAVFLVATGAEAMYADMGHFGRKPIRLTWLTVVFPGLLLNYFGQGAFLMNHPEAAENIFYALAPSSWLKIYLLIIATFATIIASQAVITGAFSLTKQVMQLGYFPKMAVLHTSATEKGQIYVPFINWFLMIATVGLVLGFRSASHLAAAYGVAVNFTMMVTTVLFYIVLRKRFGWSFLKAISLVTLFIVVELAFFGANISKVAHGAWFPLMIGALFFTVMTTWEKGRRLLSDKFKEITMNFEDFEKMLKETEHVKVNGQAVFLTGRPDVIPFALTQNVRHNRVFHSTTLLLHIKFENVPRVPNLKKIEVEKFGSGIHRIIAHHGYMEDPDVEKILTLAANSGLDINVEEVSYFLGREKLMLVKNRKMRMWRKKLFKLMSTLSADFMSFSGIPPNKAIEIGVELEL